MMESSRPPLNNKITVEDFLSFYWLKKELLIFCRTAGLASQGSKEEITQRIAHFLRTGEKLCPKTKQSIKSSYEAPLSMETVVDKDFKCTREVRNFFEKEVGPHFRFSVTLQKYIRENPGITFADIAAEFERQIVLRKSGKPKPTIDKQFEYNQFTRNYFADPKNTGKTRDDCIAAWIAHKSKRK